MRRKFLKSFITIFIISLIFLFVGSLLITPLGGGNNIQVEYVPNEVLVKFKKDMDRDSIRVAINSVQGKIISNSKDETSPDVWDPANISHRSFLLDPDLFHIKVPESIGTEQAIYYLKFNLNIEYAEENVILYSHENPNDPYYQLNWQWGLNNVGSEGPAQGTEDADIYAQEAWDFFTGSSNIVVAVIDSGVSYFHEDLWDNTWINENEVPVNYEDDDNNGYIDDYCGWDFVDEDNVPYGGTGHGTHVAGIIGAKGNNGKGITGVNWNVSIMVLRILDSEGMGDSATAIRAIDYATQNGAHLSNNSYGWEEDDPRLEKQALKDAIERARDWNEGSGGKLFIASCGNKKTWKISYPARYELENIISVLATDHNDNFASAYSNYNSVHVDLGAPGGFGRPFNVNDIFSTWFGPEPYVYLAGTSMAAPHVTGVAALIWGYPIKIWWDQVKEIILDNVDVLTSLDDKCLKEGRLNAYNPFTEPQPSAPSNLNALPTAWTQINLTWQDQSNNEIGFEIQRKKAGENDYSTIEARKENITYYHDKTASGGITHYYRVRTYNLGGNSSFSTKTVTIPATIPAAPTGLWARSPSPPDVVRLRWNDNSNNEEYFIIERKSLSYPVWQEIDGAGPNATMYFDEDVDPGETYWYRVKACNPIGDSYPSNVIEVEIFYF